jgi:AraC-like DNA-binding protein
VVDYVEAEYAGTVRLEEAARRAAYSRSGFTRFFRGKTGSSFHDFVTEVRLEHALSMLGEGLSVTGTAYAAGFTDASHFIRVFKDRFGYTPGRYQRMLVPGVGFP